MNIAIDVILAVIIASCLISGWRKGFVDTVMKLASFLIAGVGAYLFYSVPSDYMYSKLFLPKISAMIEGSILSGSTGQTLAELFNQKPKFFTDILNRYSTVGEVESFYNSGEAVSITDISSFMADPVARAISNILGFALVFIALLIVLGIITFILDKICKLPVLKSANTLLGLILGAVLGLFFAWLIAAVAGGALPHLSKAYPEVFDPMTMENSIVLKWLYNFNPLTLFKQ
ncbi:MAG: CvpA family protein [Clostridia bacterium]|nr:CvpA family protein [Clostridia bacterium]MBQ4601613.1 CvpA family protein [Clostridia bacterium]